MEKVSIFNKTGFLQKSIFHILLIIILGLLAYSNTLHVPFLFDDTTYIVGNPDIENLQHFKSPFGTEWYKSSHSLFKSRFVGFLSFALNFKLHGIDVTGYHITNLAIHIVNGLLVYWLVILIFKTSSMTQSTNQPPQDMNLIALFSALFFVSHPVQTQAVTYIWQRVTSLATMCYLLSLVMYIKYRLQVTDVGCHGSEKDNKSKVFNLKSGIWYLASIFSAILAMMTKEISFTLPLIIFLYEFMFLKGKVKKRVLFLSPLFLTMLLIPFNRIITDPLGNINISTKEFTDMSRWDYLFTQFRVIVTYIRLLFLPINQNLDYDYPVFHSFLNPNVFLSFLFLLSIFCLGVYLLYRSRSAVSGSQSNNFQLSTLNLKLVPFGIFWFFITLSVESSIFPIKDVIFEHRIYLPSVGIIITFVSIVFYYGLRFAVNRFSLHVTRNVLLSLTTIAVISLLMATYHRNTVWQGSISLWGDSVKKSPNKARAHGNLGNAYMAENWVDAAIEQYQIAIQLKPDLASAYYNLGIAYMSKNLVDAAIEQYQIAIQLKLDYADAHYNLGLAYMAKNMVDEAANEFHTVLRLNPKDETAKNNLKRLFYIKRR